VGADAAAELWALQLTVDINGDGYLSPLDVLAGVNYLNRGGDATAMLPLVLPPSGEGEPAARSTEIDLLDEAFATPDLLEDVPAFGESETRRADDGPTGDETLFPIEEVADDLLADLDELLSA
jgi:hypothetical protein